MSAERFDAYDAQDLAKAIGQLHALVGAAQRTMLEVLAAFDRREGWREDGATSAVPWLVGMLGVSSRTAAEWVEVASKLETLLRPRLLRRRPRSQSCSGTRPDPRTSAPRRRRWRLPDLEAGPSISAETARRLCCDARVVVALAGSDGRPVGVGRSRRRVPPWLLRLLRKRDGGCRFPACTHTRWAHARHLVHWARGGPTDVDNLILLCGRHHRLVHEEGWKIEGHPGEELTFVRPDGRPLATGPPALRPDVRARLAPPLLPPAA